MALPLKIVSFSQLRRQKNGRKRGMKLLPFQWGKQAVINPFHPCCQNELRSSVKSRLRQFNNILSQTVSSSNYNHWLAPCHTFTQGGIHYSIQPYNWEHWWFNNYQSHSPVAFACLSTARYSRSRLYNTIPNMHWASFSCKTQNEVVFLSFPIFFFLIFSCICLFASVLNGTQRRKNLQENFHLLGLQKRPIAKNCSISCVSYITRKTNMHMKNLKLLSYS